MYHQTGDRDNIEGSLGNNAKFITSQAYPTKNYTPSKKLRESG